ncbi:dihydrofolate reductase family protein [Blautia sp. An46]|uniref:dihydrofolate reductase family protein n=1 Tax=Blautia sp. An46 TaxID=1965636 RepID=UPI001FA893E5|nr:dihydrofolate reductase family protein [Blautia sp. An46]
MVNWSFLQAGMVDELSLVLAPVTDGGKGSASLFAQLPSQREGSPVEFTLEKAEKIGDGGLHLKYLAKNAL